MTENECISYLSSKQGVKCKATATWGTDCPMHCFRHAPSDWKERPDIYCFNEKKGGRSMASRLAEKYSNNNGAAYAPSTATSVMNPQADSGKIQFHNTIAGAYQLFSTMSNTSFSYTPLPGEVEPRTWPSVEHAFNALHYMVTPRNPEEEIILLQRINEILNAPTPAKARTIGKSAGPRTRSDWEYKDNDALFATKHLFMFDIMKAKFDQNPEAKKLLMSTGNKTIEEITPTDMHWGIGKGNGKNYLGKILMALRGYYREHN